MRRLLVPVAALAAMLLMPAAAAAKGPTGASLTGPGLAHPIVLEGYGEGSSDSPLAVLVSEGGFFPEVFVQAPRTTLIRRPKGWLGPRYDVRYTMPGGNSGDSTLRQELYPYAANGPTTYMPAGQKFWDTHSTAGGWYRGTSRLKQMLVKAGLPARSPIRKKERDHTLGVAIGAGAGVAVAAGILALIYRRRPASD
jgi:hypothetical protein